MANSGERLAYKGDIINKPRDWDMRRRLPLTDLSGSSIEITRVEVVATGSWNGLVIESGAEDSLCLDLSHQSTDYERMIGRRVAVRKDTGELVYYVRDTKGAWRQIPLAVFASSALHDLEPTPKKLDELVLAAESESRPRGHIEFATGVFLPKVDDRGHMVKLGHMPTVGERVSIALAGIDR